MTTINLKVPMLGGDDQEVVPSILLSKLLSDLIMGSSISDEPLKYFDWALDLRKSGVIAVDDTDKEKIVNFINGSQNLTVLGKGRLLRVIKEAKASPDKK